MRYTKPTILTTSRALPTITSNYKGISGGDVPNNGLTDNPAYEADE
jgi:hypothetical protein